MSEEWQPGRWYRIMQPDGTLWMETSDPSEAREESEKTGWPVQRLWSRTETEWRAESWEWIRDEDGTWRAPHHASLDTERRTVDQPTDKETRP